MSKLSNNFFFTQWQLWHYKVYDMGRREHLSVYLDIFEHILSGTVSKLKTLLLLLLFQIFFEVVHRKKIHNYFVNVLQNFIVNH